MASINWLKATTQKAGSMNRHLGRQQRIDINHSNQHINKELSVNNYTIGCNDYIDALEALKKRTSEVDAIYPPLKKAKDRITCAFLEIPCPDTLRIQGKSDEFFSKAYDVLQDFLGEENVHGGFVHKDELHEYRDKDGSVKMSLEHMHVLTSAYVEWEQKNKKTGEMIERKGINGKNFETKKRMSKLNNLMCEMCEKEFGISYNTGEKPQKKSVERLKNESALREQADSLKDEIADKKAELEAIVSQFTPSKTKTEKTFFGKEKIIEKSKEEIELEKQMAAAKMVLSERDAVEKDKQTIVQKQYQIRQDKQQLMQAQATLQQQQKALSEEREKLKYVAKSQARYEAEKLLNKQGYVRKNNLPQQQLMQSQMRREAVKEFTKNNDDYEMER